MAFEADPCRLRTAAGELIARGFIREHDETSLLIDAETLAGAWFKPGEMAVVEVLNPDRGSLTYEGIVEFAEAKRVRLRDLRLQVVRQQRSAVRVPTDLAVQVLAQVGVRPEPGEPEDAVAPGPDGRLERRLDPPWAVTVIDLSAHGLRFLADHGVEPGTQWRVHLPAPRRELDLVVEVLRPQEVRGGVAHGCRFVDAKERDHDALFSWVLDLQRLLLARRADRR